MAPAMLSRGVRGMFRALGRSPKFGIGNRVFSNSVSRGALIGTGITILSGTCVDSSSRLESYVYIGFNCLLTKVSVGRYASIANNVSLGPGEHGLDQLAMNSMFYDDPFGMLTAGDCKVGPDAWIGVDSIVRRGVEVGAGAVVGANSFVNRDVPPFAVVAGSPARLIRYRYSPPKIQRILDSRWWEAEPAEARERLRRLQSELAGG